jgi:hypothetical protein
MNDFLLCDCEGDVVPMTVEHASRKPHAGSSQALSVSFIIVVLDLSSGSVEFYFMSEPGHQCMLDLPDERLRVPGGTLLYHSKRDARLPCLYVVPSHPLVD